ncbi:MULTISPECIES: DEAD/DEAH box helicase [unclassified Aurantimonas]|uniref:DEAD/DEAH box helicase n=1 Tax=unclassified Aurantimonas TaxID=2638230 RepID=UPI002E1736B2|nr:MULTISPECIES: DEAD/DEAH box helicase [unclassified Aurantimonas]MEC5291549.1 DEAD/DEAH box helicase [Aurantimonas sp. C2-3-R2]MEC5412633.1 DEAD/DEAH box helicase [Aurantimonas sp. C2-4-R8]
MIPLPTQISGARFLAANRYALLADQPRVGKTGAAIIAADLILAETILIITTASGRGVWRKGLADWSAFDRSVEIMTPKNAGAIKAEIVIVGWPSIADPQVRAALLARRWSLLVSDEDHYAKSFDAKRTQSLYGIPDGDALMDSQALYATAGAVWPLTGTPIPHSPADMFPRMRALCPERLEAAEGKGWPDVMRYDDFLHRYCVVRMKKISNFNRIPVIVSGRNEDELAARLKGFFLLRTQKDVGIRPPAYDILPLIVSDRMKKQVEGDLDRTAVLAAAETGATKDLEMHLGPLRRLTGEIKARAVVDAVKEEFDCGLDKIVLMYWHKDVGTILEDGLAKFGAVKVDGATTPANRDAAVASFHRPDGARVFLGQIVAAGEAIDLSAAAVLWFAETSFVPAHMAQASLRITNIGQKRQAVVKVVALAGSIDEALQSRLLTLWTTIRKVLA